ncbi:MAG: polyphosphate kinase 2 family protein, partial [Acidimicrobiia bacterium]
LDDPTKRWKFRKGDLAERALWPDYMAAYEEAIASTATPDAPWYVVPADRKWYRNLVVGRILIDTLEGLGMSYPEPEEDLEGVEVV